MAHVDEQNSNFSEQQPNGKPAKLSDNANFGTSDKQPSNEASNCNLEPALQSNGFHNPAKQSASHDDRQQYKQSPPSVSLESRREESDPEEEEESGEKKRASELLTRKGKKNNSNSIWQNSLSRMSNKFSIFGGSQSKNNSTLAKDKKQSKSKQPQIQIRHQQESQPIALDSWIETKVVSFVEITT